jgi:aminoglycoside/choline kinase family phosphotransferase
MIKLFPEDPVLGTGGALRNAEAFLRDASFLVHNSDIISDMDLTKLIGCHLSSGNLATLAVHDYPEFNKLVINEQGDLKGPDGNPVDTDRYLAFTGIAVYRPEFLKLLPPGASSVVPAWFKAIASGYTIGTLDVSGCYWTDIGTPASYAKAVIKELNKNGETVYIHPAITWCNNAQMDGHVIIEKESSCYRDAELKNCIILPGTEIGGGPEDNASPECFLTLFWGAGNDPKEDQGRLSFENCILGPGFRIDLSESDLFNSSGHDAVPIGLGGSDRKYFRVKKDSKSAVLMQCSMGDQDFQRHIEYIRFFRKYLIPVPELMDADFENKSALFEDVGDISLYSWLKCPRRQDRIEEIYRKVIDILILIHTTATGHLAECALLQDRIFDYEHLRWETGYFTERFVGGVRNVQGKNPSILNDEFHILAAKVDSFPKTIIHRDFQSQNIMVTKGENPRLLDFQGARIGPPAYDVASILWDPYCPLEESLRERLLDYYIRKIIPSDPPFGKMGQRRILEDEFMKTLLPCRLQRHMQALGAYGFLSSVKGKKYFMKYIPEGLRLLREDTTLSKNEYPALNDLVNGLF